MASLKKFLLTFFIFTAITFAFLFYTSKIYTNVYVFEPLKYKQLKNSMSDFLNPLNEELQLLFKTNTPYNQIEFDYLSSQLHSGIARFLQNNKSYMYLYSKKKKLSKEDFKKLKSVVNNISVEGAYFLNPKYLDKVLIKVSYFDKNDMKLFFSYIDFIMSDQLIKVADLNKNLQLVKPIVDEMIAADNKMTELAINITNLITYLNKESEHYLLIDKIEFEREAATFIKYAEKLDEFEKKLYLFYEINKNERKRTNFFINNAIKKERDLFYLLNPKDEVYSEEDHQQFIELAASLKILVDEKIKYNEINRIFPEGYKDLISAKKSFQEIPSFRYKHDKVDDKYITDLVEKLENISNNLEELKNSKVTTDGVGIFINHDGNLLKQIKISLLNKKYYTAILEKDNGLVFSNKFFDLDKLKSIYIEKNIKLVKTGLNIKVMLSNILFAFVMSIIVIFLFSNYSNAKNNE